MKHEMLVLSLFFILYPVGYCPGSASLKELLNYAWDWRRPRRVFMSFGFGCKEFGFKSMELCSGLRNYFSLFSGSWRSPNSFTYFPISISLIKVLSVFMIAVPERLIKVSSTYTSLRIWLRVRVLRCSNALPNNCKNATPNNSNEIVVILLFLKCPNSTSKMGFGYSLFRHLMILSMKLM